MTTIDFVNNTRKLINESKSNKSVSRKAFLKLKLWIDKRVKLINIEEDSALGQLKKAFDSSENVNDINDNDMEYIIDTLDEYFDVVTIDELDGKDYEIKANLSDNLSQIMNKKSNKSHNNNKKVEWTPPSVSGLQNSLPILKNRYAMSAPPKNVSAVEFKKSKDSDQVYNNEIANKIKQRNADRNIPSEPKEIGRYRNDFQSYNEGEEDADEDDDEDEDDSDNDDQDDELDVSKLNMSANLMEALGLSTANVSKNTDWRPPTFTGLTNSKPIVRSNKSTPVSSDSGSDDDDDDYGYDNDDDENEFTPSGNMSASLMEALGLDTSHIDKTTDWKPPVQTGLNNSKPIRAGISLNSYSRK